MLCGRRCLCSPRLVCDCRPVGREAVGVDTMGVARCSWAFSCYGRRRDLSPCTWGLPEGMAWVVVATTWQIWVLAERELAKWAR